MAASPLEAKGVSSADAGAAAKASTNEAPAGPRLRCEGLQQCAMAKRLRLQSSFGPPNERRELSAITHSLGHAGTSHRLLLCSASTPRSRLSPTMYWPAIKYINDRITTLSTLWSVLYRAWCWDEIRWSGFWRQNVCVSISARRRSFLLTSDGTPQSSKCSLSEGAFCIIGTLAGGPRCAGGLGMCFEIK